MKTARHIPLLLLLAALSAPLPAEHRRWPLPAEALEGDMRWLDANGDRVRDLFVVQRRRIKCWLHDPARGFPQAPSLTFDVPDQYACITFAAMHTTDSLKSVFAMSAGGIAAAPLFPTANGAKISAAPLAFSPVVRFPTSVTAHPSHINWADFIFDLNGDGRAELLIPGKTGYVILTRAQGAWRTLAEIGAAEPPRISLSAEPAAQYEFIGHPLPTLWSQFYRGAFSSRADRTRYQFATRWPLETLQIADLNRDGRLDLQTTFFSAQQTSTGSFQSEPRRPTSSAEPESLMFGEYGYGVCDINGDGRPDRISTTSEGGAFSVKTRIHIELGAAADGAAEASKPIVFRSGDLALASLNGRKLLIDFDNDGDLDLHLIHIEHKRTSAEANLKAFFDRGIKGEIRCFLWRDGGYPPKPAFTFPLMFRYDVFGMPQLESLPYHLGFDYDGDGFTDLLLKTAPDELALHRFVNATQGFDPRPRPFVRTAAPIDTFEILTVSEDARADLLVVTKEPKRSSAAPPTLYYSAPPREP